MEPAAPPPLGEIAVALAHDLRNPLSALTTNLHFLRGALGQAGSDAQEALDESFTLCQILERLLRNLDVLGRGDGLAGRLAPVALGALARDVVRRVRGQARTSGIALHVDGGDATALADAELLGRALENALADTIERAPAGARVEIAILEAGDEVAVEVRDPPDAAPRGQGTHLQAVHGRGLALLAAATAARAAGARLAIEGAPGPCRLRLVAPRSR